MLAYQHGDRQESRALIDEAQRTFRQAGILRGTVQTAEIMAALALRDGNFERAGPAAIECLDANEILGHKLGIPVSIKALALLAVSHWLVEEPPNHREVAVSLVVRVPGRGSACWSCEPIP